MKVLAVIPARGGSKGVPGKNKLMIAGQPLIVYTIQEAKKSARLSEIYVSSDDEEILDIAKSFGCKLHVRPRGLATDDSPVTETIQHILQHEDKSIDAVLVLQPTSPLRTVQDIDNAISILTAHPHVQSVISVVPMDDIHPARMYKLNDQQLMEPFLPEYEQVRRQEIPLAYYRNGSIYLTRLQAFLANNSLMNKPIKPYIMDFEWLLNIDSPRDVLIAEALIPAWKGHVRS